jgi:hypothetical protein
MDTLDFVTVVLVVIVVIAALLYPIEDWHDENDDQ